MIVDPPPDTFHQKIFDLPGKEREGKKGKWRRKEKKSKKREGGNLEMEGGKMAK